MLQAPWSGTAGGKDISSEAAGEKLQKTSSTAKGTWLRLQRGTESKGTFWFDLNEHFV